MNQSEKREFCERFNAAMAEAGWLMQGMVVGTDGHMYAAPTPYIAPPAVVWQALMLAKRSDPMPCWSCWSVANAADPLGDDYERGSWGSDCVTGRRGGCHFPEGPARPPRELLVTS